MAYVEPVRGCCGVKELSDISYDSADPKKSVQAVFMHNAKPHCSHVFFTQAGTGVYSTYGEGLKNYILTHKLGDVVESTPAVNPNSTNQVIMYVWTVDWKALRQHCISK